MRFLIINTPYAGFLDEVYCSHTGLESKSYQQQWRIIAGKCFGTLDFYASNLRSIGCEAAEIAANCQHLQLRWARENGLKVRKPSWIKHIIQTKRPSARHQNMDWFVYPILKAQIEHYKPDVLLVHNVIKTSVEFLRAVKPNVRLLVGQIAAPVSDDNHLEEYDLILSSLPNFVKRFQQKGVASEYFKLGFEKSIISHLNNQKNKFGLVFVGGLSAHHKERIRLLEKIADSYPLKVWGYGINSLNHNSPLKALYQGEAWGLKMYNIISSAQVVLNNHIGIAENYANNMRLFETTGVGAALITDYKQNLCDMFEPGKELLAYRSHDECFEMIDFLLRKEKPRQAIAQAGQQRTLNEHTYYHRMQRLVQITGRLI